MIKFIPAKFGYAMGSFSLFLSPTSYLSRYLFDFFFNCNLNPEAMFKVDCCRKVIPRQRRPKLQIHCLIFPTLKTKFFDWFYDSVCVCVYLLFKTCEDEFKASRVTSIVKFVTVKILIRHYMLIKRRSARLCKDVRESRSLYVNYFIFSVVEF